ncbi:EexN family lipoprotein [Vibrio parahaemolyticus]
MKTFTLSFLLLTISFIQGCGEEEVKTVEWYKNHQTERIELLKLCKNDINKAKTPNCINASNAQSKINLDSILYGDGISIK